jgi:hypothetical protein
MSKVGCFVLHFLARCDDFLVGQAIRLSPPAVAGAWLRLCRIVGQDCILLAGFQPAFLRLSSAPLSAPMKAALHKLSRIP